MLSLRPLAVAALVLAATSLTGCVPTVWLPDSSGFIFVKPIKVAGEPSGQLVHYDLQKKTSRVIVEDIGKATVWPALSSDGKRIAVARSTGAPKQAKTLQIVLHDFEGKQLHLSPVFSWAPPPKEAAFAIDMSPVMLFWSPKDDMVVVTDGNVSGIYDVKKDSLKVIGKAMPLIHGGSPIRPDGKGILLLMGEKENQRLVFMDWEGKEQKIDADAFVGVMPKDSNPANTPLATTGLAALILPSWWDGTSAWVGFKRDKATYAIDTVKKKVDFTEAFAALVKVDKNVGDNMPIAFDFAGDITVKTVRFKGEIQGQPQIKGQATFNKVIVVNNKTKKEATLLAKGPGMALFLPSPDGNYLALCMTGFGLGIDDQILVINNKGELHSTLSLER
jgi:hypothetical protein